jgi:hypothetical protein
MPRFVKDLGLVLLLVGGVIVWFRYASTSVLRIDTATPPQAAISNPLDVDDGCRIDSDHSKIRYEKYSALDESELSYYQSVKKCATDNFERSLLQKDESNLLDANRLICERRIDHATLLSVIERHDNILMVGDSVVRQQFFTLICMVDPSLKAQDLVKYNATGDVVYEIQWDYNRVDGGTTSFLYRILGLAFDAQLTNLYREAFPTAVLTFSDKDAIVVDASRHHDESNAQSLFISAHFVAMARSRAPIYYMEPTPMEFSTSNGFYPLACVDITCHCERLDEARLMGKGALPTALVEAAIKQNAGSLPSSRDLAPILYELYPGQLNASNPINAKLCLPSCVPATWRSDLVKKTLKDAAPRVTIIPTFWQLASQDIPTTLLRSWDCAHRNFGGIVLMNEQLIRAMQRR